jgi:glycosyltransferase involved in cell wall biosynthesis
MAPGASELDVFYAFSDTPQRRAALEAAPGSAERYCLFGLDQLQERGLRIRHNLERSPGLTARLAERLVNRSLERRGAWGGEVATVLASRSRANAADVVFSTAERVGIPLVLAAQRGLVRPPIVYAWLGPLDRLERLRGRMRQRYADALAATACIVTHSEHKAELFRQWLRESGRDTRVSFVPFGVDPGEFRPQDKPTPEVDVVSVGADPRRDFPLLVALADRNPELRLRIVASRHSVPNGAVPANVDMEVEVPFERMRHALGAAQVVALPVRHNIYTGATTTLLQAMALGQAVVVSRTQAIASGYGLVDGDNCRLVEPGDLEGFEAALLDLLHDREARAAMGARARETVERSLTWDRYVESLYGLLREAAERHSGP